MDKKQNTEKAIVLVSGGMDSLVTLAIALKKHDVAALHVNYGQRTQSRELLAFKKICDFYKIKERQIVDIAYLAKIGGSALTDKSFAIPRSDKPGKPHAKAGAIPVTYVPFRNTNIIAIAVSWAEVLGAKRIFIGAVEEDGSGYPDCRKSYYEAFNKLIKEGTKPGSGIRIETPLIRMSKGEIVKKGFTLKVPFSLSWSCYGSSKKACGVCDSCRLRLKGFAEANQKDPLPYSK